MRRIVVGLSVLALILVAGMAMAGDYHTAELTVCSDCHTAHYSITHTYAGGTPPTAGYDSMGTAGPYERLLKNEVNHLCLSCHDGQDGTADVLGDNDGNAGDIRQAGALNVDPTAGLGANDAGYNTYTGHTLGVKSTAAPGGQAGSENPAFTTSATEGLTCVDCHTPHGSAGSTVDLAGDPITSLYRNARVEDGDGVRHGMTYDIGTWTGTKDVFERVARQYDHTNVDFEKLTVGTGEAAVDNESAYGKYCMSCHTDFHGGETNASAANTYDAGTTHFIRHPTAEALISTSATGTWKGFSGGVDLGKTNFVKVMSDTNAWGMDATNPSPSCFSCHKAHGNKNPFGLIYMAGNTGTINEEGTSTNTGMMSLCKQCHGMGGAVL